MRWVLLLAFVSVETFCFAQVQKTWVGDTAKVHASVFEGDTMYQVKWKFRAGKWSVYYDADLTQRASWFNFYSEYSYDDSAWHRNGQLQTYLLTKEKITFGCYESKSWFPDGKIKSTNLCTGDSSVQIEYYHNGQIKKRLNSWRDSVPGNWIVSHTVVEYYENGQKKYDANDANGPRTNQRYYHENGQPSREIFWQGDFTVGVCKEWHLNGNLKGEGQYEMPLFLRNIYPVKKIGTWSYYNESGKLIKEEYYEEGKLVKTVEY